MRQTQRLFLASRCFSLSFLSQGLQPPQLNTTWAPLLTPEELQRGITYYGSGARLRRLARLLLDGQPVKAVAIGGSVTAAYGPKCVGSAGRALCLRAVGPPSGGRTDSPLVSQTTCWPPVLAARTEQTTLRGSRRRSAPTFPPGKHSWAQLSPSLAGRATDSSCLQLLTCLQRPSSVPPAATSRQCSRVAARGTARSSSPASTIWCQRMQTLWW